MMEKVCFKIDAGLVLLVFDIAVASVDHSYVLFYQRIYDVLLKVWGCHSEGPPIANPNPNPIPQRTFAMAAPRYGGPTPF